MTELKKILIILNPIAPHITSEIFKDNFKYDILTENFPEYDDEKIIADEIEIPVQINGKLKGTMKIPNNATQEQILDLLKNKEFYCPNQILKSVFVKNKIINLIIKMTTH